MGGMDRGQGPVFFPFDFGGVVGIIEAHLVLVYSVELLLVR